MGRLILLLVVMAFSSHPQPSPALQPLTVPDVMGQTGLVQVILNHGQFTKSLQTRAKVQNV